MRLVVLTVFAAISLASAPAFAQDGTTRDEASSPGQLGILATTPSRMENSRREMNRGREQIWRANMTPTQTRQYAEQALRRGGFECAVIDAVMVAQMGDGAPLVEVDCQEGGGLIIADTDPLQATDCLDLGPGAGVPAAGGARVDACRLPANIASVAAERQSARN